MTDHEKCRDAPRIKDASARFENMIAAELYRAVTLWNDMGYGDFSLHFVKNKEKQEVDFLKTYRPCQRRNAISRICIFSF